MPPRRQRSVAEGRSRQPSERDIYTAAVIMVRRYGEDAATQAAMHADAFGAENDVDGQRQWIRIMKAIEELQSMEKPAGAPVH